MGENIGCALYRSTGHSHICTVVDASCKRNLLQTTKLALFFCQQGFSYRVAQSNQLACNT